MKLVEIANEAPKTQQDWINWHNDKGKVMASLADIYIGVKIGYSVDEDAKTSTKIIWTPGQTSKGKIVHNIDSKFTKPKESPEILIPDLSFNPSCRDLNRLAYALMSEERKKFMKELFGTDDDPIEIIETIEKLGRTSRDKIFIETPYEDLRNENSEVAIVFDKHDNLFIKCYAGSFFRKSKAYGVIK